MYATCVVLLPCKQKPPLALEALQQVLAASQTAPGGTTSHLNLLSRLRRHQPSFIKSVLHPVLATLRQSARQYTVTVNRAKPPRELS